MTSNFQTMWVKFRSGQSVPLSFFNPTPGNYFIWREYLCDLTNRDEISKKVYLGESYDLHQGLRSQFRALERGTHPCKALQDDWKEFGAKAFFFTILGDGPAFKNPTFRKKKAVARLARLDPRFCYNDRDNMFRVLGRPITFPDYLTREGRIITGGTFESVREAARVTGWSRSKIYRRLDSSKYPDWRDLTVEEKEAQAHEREKLAE